MHIDSSIWCIRNTTVDKEGAWGQPCAAKMTRQENTVCWQKYWHIPWDGDNIMNGGLSATKKRHWHLLEQPDSHTINSHSVVPSVSNPLGSAGPRIDNFIVPLFLKCFPCVSFTWLYTITCAKLSVHSVLMTTKTTDGICYSTTTGDCSVLHFLWRCTQTSSNTEAFLSCHRGNNQSKFKVYWIPHCYTHLPAWPQHHGKPRPWSVEELMPPEAPLLFPAGCRKLVACPDSLPL